MERGLVVCTHNKKYSYGEAGCIICANYDKTKHLDTGGRCLVAHGNNMQCKRCTCGKYVPPDEWDKHVLDNAE